MIKTNTKNLRKFKKVKCKFFIYYNCIRDYKFKFLNKFEISF